MALPDQPKTGSQPVGTGRPAPAVGLRVHRRGRPPLRPGGPEWRARQVASGGLSAALHALALLLMLGLPTPPAPPVAEAPPKIYEVEFIDVPAVNPARAAAPAPAEVEAPKPVAEAPVRPRVPPRPAAAAAPRRTATQVARPRPATERQRPLRQADRVPVRRPVDQAELQRRLAARLRGSDTAAAERLRALERGTDATTPAAPERAAGRPIVSHNSPMGELSGRGVLYAPTPDYPERAQRQVWEGTVRVRVYVDASGSVSRAIVEGSSGYPSLDAAARAAAAAYRFSPLADGEGAVQSGVIPFTFVIR